MKRARRGAAHGPVIAAALLLSVALLGATASPSGAATPPPSAPAGTQAAAVTFDEPTASAILLKPLSFEQTIHSPTEPTRMELLTISPGDAGTSVHEALFGRSDVAAYKATVSNADHVTPNTIFDYRFRVTMPDGSQALGPQARVVETDDRFSWHTLNGPVVHLHWYEGDQAFAQRALDLGQKAITTAANLLGVTNIDPVDFFIYADQKSFYDALGPGTPENVGGQFIGDTQTLFADIGPAEIASDYVETVVPHELTHLVFSIATKNPYHDPPRWLDEGLAVYLSEGGPGPRAADLQAGIQDAVLIPLDGLSGFFPSTPRAFGLAYAEAVSAVDFFIRSYGKPALVQLIRSYADGVSDDAAFRAATGASVAAFGAAWIADLGATSPRAYGPRPAPTGPLPAGWAGEAQPSPAASAVGGIIATPRPVATPLAAVPLAADRAADVWPLLGIVTLAVGSMLLAVLVLGRRRHGVEHP